MQARQRMVVRKEELEDVLHDIELRLEEEEEKVVAMMEDRKKYNQTIQDLEEQYVELQTHSFLKHLLVQTSLTTSKMLCFFSP